MDTGRTKPATRTHAPPPGDSRAAADAGGPAPSRLTADDVYLFNEGTHAHLFEKLGAHPASAPRPGTTFAVWAPDAQHVSVVGDFNGWQPGKAPLISRGPSGIWEGFVPGVGEGDLYKFHVESRFNGLVGEKADPVGLAHEVPPRTASRVATLGYTWGDADWLERRAKTESLHEPMSVYEVHLGSWRRKPEEGNRPLTYRELAETLPDYAADLGFTHVEFMPVMEHPFDGSWGYQTTGYFAPTSRFGTPQDFMHLIDRLHQRGIGVILDWVPSHFATDAHGPGFFDGTHLYEHADPRQGFHPDWTSFVFNYGRNEVRSFLLSSATLWVEKYHADALRVDAVASMLYLDYSRRGGEWIPNRHGGNENLDAVTFLRQLNESLYRAGAGVQTVAEESTAWPMVSRPTYVGGLGFGYKWDMGWMHDTLRYFSRDPVHRKYHHNDLTFRGLYAFTENYILPLSHDEVVHGKGSLVGRMPGDEWQKFANLRALYGYMWATPGKKLLFMGGEFGQHDEWSHTRSLDWHLLQWRPHAGVQALVRALNRVYRDEPALHTLDCDPAGFEWIDASDTEQSVLSFIRRGRGGEAVVVVCSLTPVPRTGYRVGVPRAGAWREIVNTDAAEFGGSGHFLSGAVNSEPVPMHGREHSISLNLPPLAVVMLKAD